MALAKQTEIENSERRKLGNWRALRAEILDNGSQAAKYLKADVPLPTYRLSLLVYREAFPSLLADDEITEQESAALIRFYSEIETFNRALNLGEASAAQHKAK